MVTVADGTVAGSGYDVLVLDDDGRILLDHQFGWVIGDRKRSPRNAHECLVVIGLATDAAVDKLVRRARDAGAKIIIEAGSQKWGYAGAFADPDGHMWQVSRADGFLTR
jgi:predicted lactoylglutathione lyase